MLDEHAIVAGDAILNLAIGPPNGSPLLLLPGFTRNWRSFQPILPTFVPRWHIHALDYRGHGKSARMPGHYRALDFLGDAQCVLRQCFAEPPVILGHSMGGWLAMALAESLPDLVRAIIVGDTTLDIVGFKALMPMPEVCDFYRPQQALAGRPVDEILPILEASGTPPEEAEELNQLDPSVLDLHVAGDGEGYFGGIDNIRLTQISCPVLFIQGNPALGGMLSDADVQHALATVPTASHVRIDHAGHDLGFWKGELGPFVDAVTAFLDTL